MNHLPDGATVNTLRTQCVGAVVHLEAHATRLHRRADLARPADHELREAALCCAATADLLPQLDAALGALTAPAPAVAQRPPETLLALVTR